MKQYFGEVNCSVAGCSGVAFYHIVNRSSPWFACEDHGAMIQSADRVKLEERPKNPEGEKCWISGCVKKATFKLTSPTGSKDTYRCDDHAHVLVDWTKEPLEHKVVEMCLVAHCSERATHEVINRATKQFVCDTHAAMVARVDLVSLEYRGVPAIRMWDEMSHEDQRYSFQFFTGGLDMVAYGFTTRNKDHEKAKWALCELHKALAKRNPDPKHPKPNKSDLDRAFLEIQGTMAEVGIAVDANTMVKIGATLERLLDSTNVGTVPLNAPVTNEERLPRIDALVNRFLAWPLPESVSSDACVMQSGYPNRIGTNLLTATEAKQMIEYLLDERTLPKVWPEERSCIEEASVDIQKLMRLDPDIMETKMVPLGRILNKLVARAIDENRTAEMNEGPGSKRRPLVHLEAAAPQSASSQFQKISTEEWVNAREEVFAQSIQLQKDTLAEIREIIAILRPAKRTIDPSRLEVFVRQLENEAEYVDVAKRLRAQFIGGAKQ